MIEKENNKYSTIAINDAKNERFREKSNILSLLLKIKIRKVKILKKQSKNLKMMKTMNLKIY